MNKKVKPQGKLNHSIVLKGLIEGKKKKDIAVEAGSFAKSDSGKCNAVNRVMKSDEFSALLNKELPDKLIVKTLRDGLSAVVPGTNKFPDYGVRLRSIDMICKIRGLYPKE